MGASPFDAPLGRKLRKSGQALAFHLLVAAAGIAMVYPLLWLAGSSLKPADEVWANLSALWPHKPTLDNYTNGWRGFGGTSFAVFYKNSIIFSGLGTLFAVVSSSFIAFGFARIRFPGRTFWFTCMLLTLMLPAEIQVIPQYLLFSKLKLVNTFVPLLLPRLCGQAFFIFMIMQFIRGVPVELDEAAAIDGYGRFGVFTRIMTPLVAPAMITAAIFSFYWTWGDFLHPLIYLNSPKLYVVSVALRTFADPSAQSDWGAIYAMSFLSLIPMLLVFVAFQRYIVEGIATSGLKG
jgi:multiple sugar transport system permease protein